MIFPDRVVVFRTSEWSMDIIMVASGGVVAEEGVPLRDTVPPSMGYDNVNPERFRRISACASEVKSEPLSRKSRHWDMEPELSIYSPVFPNLTVATLSLMGMDASSEPNSTVIV